MDVIKAVGMNVGKRYLMIAIVMMIVLLSAFLLFACSDLDEGGDSDPLLLNEYPLTEEDASHVGGSRIGKDTADATSSGDASQPADSTGSDDTQQNGDATQPTDTTQPGDTTGGENTQGTGNTDGGENTQGTGDTDNDEDLQALVTQYGLAVAGGYWPAKYRGARAEWTLFVGGRELGPGTMSESGILSTTVFTETEIELWGKDAEGGAVPYLYFTTLQGFREVFFRVELGALQIDVTAEELALLLPSSTSGEGGETGAPDDQGAGSQQTDQSQPTGDLDGQNGEGASGGSEGGSGGDENASGNNENTSGNGEGTEQGGESNSSQTQVQAVSLPEQSAAYAWFVTFPGTPTDLVVTTLNEQAEIYSFKLVSLDASDAETLIAALTSGGGFDQESAGGRHDIYVQKEFGEKHFTISVALTGDGNGYKAEVSVTGFVDEE